MSPPCWRSYMLVSTSRTIGYSISPAVSANSSIGPTLIIWCTIGVSGIRAPAIRAIRGLQTPQQIAQTSVSMSPSLVRTALTRPAGDLSMPSTSAPASTRSAPSCWACSRISVPARSESTTPTVGKCAPPRITDSSRYGTSLATPAGVSSSAGMPQAFAAVQRRRSSCIRSGVRATSMPAALGEDAEFLVLLGAVAGELHHHLRVLDREDEVGGVAGRAARVRHRALVDQDQVPPAEPGEVIGEAVADDARPDDDGASQSECRSCRSSRPRPPAVAADRLGLHIAMRLLDRDLLVDRGRGRSPAACARSARRRRPTIASTYIAPM